MGNDTLSGVRMYGMVPAPLAAQNYKLGAVLVRNSAKECLIPIGDIESWAAEGYKEAAASVLRDVHAACAAWSTDGFMKRVREEAKSPTASVITDTYDGKAIKLTFSYYGEESMKTESANTFTALVEWLAKLRGSSKTKSHQKLLELRQYSLDRGWDPMSWTLNRQRAIPGEWTGNLDSRIYIITDVLLASAVSTEHSSNGSLDAGVNPLALAALAHGVALPTHTPEVSMKASKVSKEGIKRTGAPKLVAFRVIGAEYHSDTGKLTHLHTLQRAMEHRALPADTLPCAANMQPRVADKMTQVSPHMQAKMEARMPDETKPSEMQTHAMHNLEDVMGPEYLVDLWMKQSKFLMGPSDQSVMDFEIFEPEDAMCQPSNLEAAKVRKGTIGEGNVRKRTTKLKAPVAKKPRGIE